MSETGKKSGGADQRQLLDANRLPGRPLSELADRLRRTFLDILFHRRNDLEYDASNDRYYFMTDCVCRETEQAVVIQVDYNTYGRHDSGSIIFAIDKISNEIKFVIKPKEDSAVINHTAVMQMATNLVHLLQDILLGSERTQGHPDKA